ncbi:hypothetical protein CN378_18215 [Bacillus sp. AFS015802]|uniref:hypothetical protein n=1 Tax=Bacillus sp. AFS015802 TaxID=2033486 RepID=UPI000BF48637|nr:hypothetical protein [Bacillus sp. AFS015802]PFA62976.1 hypothetical protein CN378_18215 [Bacillus sp. AFS015802]
MMKRLTLSLVILLYSLAGCSNSEHVMEIEHKEKAGSLFIQKVENNTSTEELTKVVQDQDQIKEVLTKIEGLKVEKISSDKMMDKMKSTDTYMFVFSEGKEMEAGKAAPFAFHVLEDGTFLFPYSGFDAPQEPLITVDKHEERLDELKQLLGIKF